MTVDSCRMGEIESVRTVELASVGRLLRVGCDPFLMSMCGFVGGGETLWEQNGYHRNILLSAENQSEGGEAETKGLIM